MLERFARLLAVATLAAIRLTPVGAGAAFVVDDVYIDPFYSR